MSKTDERLEKIDTVLQTIKHTACSEFRREGLTICDALTCMCGFVGDFLLFASEQVKHPIDDVVSTFNEGLKDFFEDNKDLYKKELQDEQTKKK